MKSDLIKKIDPNEAYLFRKKVTKLKKFKGQGTELISLYTPPATNRSSVMDQLSAEVSQSSNIKDPKTRKNVQSALRKIMGFLRRIDFKLPETGLCVYAGNISEQPGKTDVRLFTIRPITRLDTKLYWCDSKFNLEPLSSMMSPSEAYGLITIDKNESTIAILKGKKYEIIGHFKSRVPGKIRAGGQCIAPESLVQLFDGRITPIKDLEIGEEVTSVDPKTKEFKTSKVKAKWKSKKQLLDITTKFPQLKLNCSKDHTVFIARPEGILEIRAGDLKVGDKLIMPETIPTNTQKIFLHGQYYNSYKVSKNGLEFLCKKRKKLFKSQKNLGRKLEIHQASISAFEKGKFNPSINYLTKYCTALNLELEKFITKYCKTTSNINLPKMLTKELAQFLGYFAGDGSFEKERLTFFEQNKAVIETYLEMSKIIFNSNTSVKFRENKNYYQLRVYGKPIVEFIKNEFPELKKAQDTVIPDKILVSGNELLGAFLRGFYDAEGYATKTRLGLGINNKRLAKEIQIGLLRFGIISSIHIYDNSRNPYSNNKRYTIDITERESLIKFFQNIGFTSPKKNINLAELAEKKSKKSNVRQIIKSGSTIKNILEHEGLSIAYFAKASGFFNDKREMGKKTFRNSIMSQISINSQIYKKMNNIVKIPLLPVKIEKIEKKNIIQMYDIDVENSNFFADGLLVHNSAQRFEHLREEAEHDFYKKISENANQIFLKNIERLKGIIIGGPGLTKKYFIETELMDHRLKNKILGKVDLSYTDESGIREMVNKSEDLLKDAEIMHEKKIMQNFMTEISTTGLATYGEKETIEAIKEGRAKTVLISEEIDKVVKIEESEKKDEDDDDEMDFLDWITDLAQDTGAEIRVISTETEEGSQFYNGFGGIGAILRY